VEKRLAALEVKARIDEDDETLRLRLPEGTDVAPVKALMALPGKLELCEELPDDARAWCKTEPQPGVSRLTEEPPGEGCYFEGKDEKALRDTAAKGISGRVLLQKTRAGWRTFAAPQGCLAPGITEATVKASDYSPFPNVQLRFDRDGAKQFEALTTRLLRKRLLLVLDGEVQMAPVVQTPIPGGAAMITTGTGDQSVAQVLAAALQGGPLPKLTLTKERTYGPPSLK